MGLFTKLFAKSEIRQRAENILWFKEISKADIPSVGGKGANLGELMGAGLPVPDGFVLTVKAYFDFLKKYQIERKILQTTIGLDVENNPALNKAAKEIKEEILKHPLPSDLEKEIISAYKKLGPPAGGGNELVAVRSSATAEDLPTASFAGQQATFLNVQGEKELIEAVKKAWASLFEPRAIYYRTVNHFDHLKVGLAVPVQKMVQSEVAGVMFTIDPVKNDKSKIVIDAAYGLGEIVVSGAVTPDHYVVEKKSLKILEKKIAKQTWEIKKSGSGNKKVDVLPELQEKQKLTDEQIIELAKIGLKIEDHYQFPQDTEWALEGGKIFMVQSRPVTTLKQVTVNSKQVTGTQESKILVKGLPASVGQAGGKVQIIRNASELVKINKGEVLVAKLTNPSYVPAMKRAAGIVTDQGGQTSHAAIVSRELAIPAVVGTGNATKVLKNGQMVTVDGETGLVYEGEVTIREQVSGSSKEKEYPKTRTKIYCNLAEVEAAEKVAKLPVDGVGLLRAEFMMAEIGFHPKEAIRLGEEKQYIKKLTQGITAFASAFSPRPVIYRGSDFKTNEYRNLKGGEKYEKEEANPMIGYRGAIRYLQDPEEFNLELEALKVVRQKYKNIHLMIPFVRTVNELEKVKLLVEQAGLKRSEDFRLYLMVEIPSNVILLEDFIKLGIDGVSIGSNDLTQLTLGLDRDNERIASEFDERNEAVKKLMAQTIQIAKKHGVSSSICGQAPSVYPEITEFLVREGIDGISVNPDTIIKTREIVAEVEKKL